ncbi:hypothetical protein ACH4TE_34500 [Streptomyces sioyaensis]|uniref:hypothetical protein n=1 Tax=Streptomyces sioyaensis TaxID=67364 RepID=UPI0037B313E8
MSAGQRPRVGDEVEYAPGRRAVVTDIRKGVLFLRRPGRREWPVAEPEALSVSRTRTQRLADGDFG